MKFFSIFQKNSILFLALLKFYLLAEGSRRNKQQIYVFLLTKRGLVCLEERKKVFYLTFLDLKFATATDKLKNGGQSWHSPTKPKYLPQLLLVEHILFNQSRLELLVFLNTDTVQEKQLVKENKHRLLHFLNAFLIIYRTPLLPMSDCVPKQQIPRQLVIKVRLEHGEIAEIGHPANPRIPKPRKEQKNIPVPNLIVCEERMYILHQITHTQISRYPFSVRSNASKMLSGENYLGENPQSFSFIFSIQIQRKCTFSNTVMTRHSIEAILLFLYEVAVISRFGEGEVIHRIYIITVDRKQFHQSLSLHLSPIIKYYYYPVCFTVSPLLIETDHITANLFLFITMIKKPNLQINTDFFEDSLNGLHIPEAIKVTQSIDTQTFIKQGLNDDEDLAQLKLQAISSIQKVINNYTISAFLACWERLKESIQNQSTPHSHSRRRGEQIFTQNIPSEEFILNHQNSEKGLNRQNGHMSSLLQNASNPTSKLQWLEEQRERIRSKHNQQSSIIRRPSPAQKHLERAKILKEIADKLKNGKMMISGMIQRFDSERESGKISSRLEKLQKNMHYYSIETRAQQNYPVFKVQRQPEKAEAKRQEEVDNLFAEKIRSQLLEVKKELQHIRQQNEKIYREEQVKNEEISKIASTKEEIASQYYLIKSHLERLEQEKRRAERNQLNFNNELSQRKLRQRQYEMKINYLSQRLQERERQQPLIHHIVPMQPNPFGYSTFTSSNHNSRVAGRPPSQRLLNSPPPPQFQLNLQKGEPVDSWACC